VAIEVADAVDIVATVATDMVVIIVMAAVITDVVTDMAGQYLLS
jgi:hypothetical protein